MHRHRSLLMAVALASLLFSGAGLASHPPTPVASQASPALDRLIERRMEEAGLVGLGAAIIIDRKLVWSRGYGFSDKQQGLRFTLDTVMNIGSISKTFTGVAYGKAVMAAWDVAAPAAAPMRKQEEELTRRGDMLALYRFVNRPDMLRIGIDSDFAAALQDPSPSHYGQLYVAGWEARNLRMVANIRVAFRDQSGARVLSIVGSSHKPWFDNLLGQMQGVDIVDVERVLE